MPVVQFFSLFILSVILRRFFYSWFFSTSGTLSFYIAVLTLLPHPVNLVQINLIHYKWECLANVPITHSLADTLNCGQIPRTVDTHWWVNLTVNVKRDYPNDGIVISFAYEKRWKPSFSRRQLEVLIAYDCHW